MLVLVKRATERYRWRKELWKPLREGSKKRKYACAKRTAEGPSDKGVWTRYLSFTGPTGDYRAIYIRIEPDALLGYECCPASGEMLIRALDKLAAWLTPRIGPVDVQELLRARLYYFEFAVDVLGLPPGSLHDLPINVNADSFYLAEEVWDYAGCFAKNTGTVVYDKKTSQGTRARLERRFRKTSAQTVIRAKGANQTLLTLMRSEELAVVLKKRCFEGFGLRRGIRVVSLGCARALVSRDTFCHKERLLAALEITRANVQTSKELKAEFKYAKRVLSDRYGVVVGLRSNEAFVVDGLPEALERAIDAFQADNCAAIETWAASRYKADLAPVAAPHRQDSRPAAQDAVLGNGGAARDERRIPAGKAGSPLMPTFLSILRFPRTDVFQRSICNFALVSLVRQTGFRKRGPPDQNRAKLLMVNHSPRCGQIDPFAVCVRHKMQRWTRHGGTHSAIQAPRVGAANGRQGSCRSVPRGGRSLSHFVAHSGVLDCSCAL